jgi:SAM-dependent methyltransferase
VAAGFEVVGVDSLKSACDVAARRLGDRGRIVCGEPSSLADTSGRFDVCVLSSTIEYARDPVASLEEARSLLRTGGCLLIALPPAHPPFAGSVAGELTRTKRSQLFYFDDQTIQSALFRSGFHEIVVRADCDTATVPVVTASEAPAPRHATLSEDPASEAPAEGPPKVAELAASRAPEPVQATHRLLRLARAMLPRAWREPQQRTASMGTLVLARARPEGPAPRLSIIVPAYNEAATLEPLMQGLLARRPRGLDFEVILVESASTDGTREIAQRYAAHPQVKLILEEAPKGKGHAVRTGLRQASGHFILIQDADLEYDLEDYDPLLEPLIQHREAFVLGSRHGGSAWKMRRFTGQWHLSAFLNLGHWFFTGLVNHLFGQRLRDPFTMYKVFRRDCLYGLRFSCNRFDFDFELLVKLVRKGYRPLEIPVNYRSRSFREGKKVSMWRDPLSWLRVLARLRLETVNPLAEIERQRLESGPVR